MLPTFDFITALKVASHAMATNDVRYYLNGVLFRFVGDTLLLTGSDGHRIAKVRLNVKGCQLSGDYIVKCDAVKAALQTVKAKRNDASQTKLEPAPGGQNGRSVVNRRPVRTGPGSSGRPVPGLRKRHTAN